MDLRNKSKSDSVFRRSAHFYCTVFGQAINHMTKITRFVDFRYWLIEHTFVNDIAMCASCTSVAVRERPACWEQFLNITNYHTYLDNFRRHNVMDIFGRRFWLALDLDWTGFESCPNFTLPWREFNPARRSPSRAVSRYRSGIDAGYTRGLLARCVLFHHR